MSLRAAGVASLDAAHDAQHALRAIAAAAPEASCLAAVRVRCREVSGRQLAWRLEVGREPLAVAVYERGWPCARCRDVGNARRLGAAPVLAAPVAAHAPRQATIREVAGTAGVGPSRHIHIHSRHVGWWCLEPGPIGLSMGRDPRRGQ